MDPTGAIPDDMYVCPRCGKLFQPEGDSDCTTADCEPE